MLRVLPILCALLACVCLQALAAASPIDEGQPGQKRVGAEARKRDPNVAPGDRVKRAEMRVGAADRLRASRDPVKVAASMIQKFDQDADAKLNAEELTAMLTFLQERRGQQGRVADKGDRRRPEAEKSSLGKSASDDEVGGITPIRPPAE
ncbi:MAG: hypothetical protein ABI557_17975 [Aureliella sp.]